MGARQVIGVDNKPARVEAGLKFGATQTVNDADENALHAVESLTAGNLADVVIEAAGEVDSINLMPHLVKVGGHLLFFGVPRAYEFQFDFWTLFRKYCHTTSSGGTSLEPGAKSFRMAIDLVAGGEIEVSPMITHRFPFERVQEAYELARTREDGAIKILIEMPR